MNNNTAILHAAFAAWNAASHLRTRRERNKRFTYGDQWGDTSLDSSGRCISDWDRYNKEGHPPITNNVLRQLVKSIVGRFRSQYLDKATQQGGGKPAGTAELDELDARLLEEFLISGVCLQRVDLVHDLLEKHTQVSNVNVNRFFINTIADPLARDCEIVGQVHDLSVAALIKQVAAGSRRKAAWVRRLYSEDVEARTASLATALGADSQSGTHFWYCPTGKCRAIEVWTLESHEVLTCHNRATSQVFVAPIGQLKKLKSNPDMSVSWDIATTWHCRWFSPMGDLLAEYDSPYRHGSHPYVMRFYPLTDGEIHSFIEDMIDQQKLVNRLVTMVDHVMNSSAKGVLLYPENAMPDGFTWSQVRQVWRSCDGVLPYNPQLGEAKPEQISANNTNFGAYPMIELQLKMLEHISGVSGALRGQNVDTRGSSTLYQTQADNAAIALADIFDTFNAFRQSRQAKLARL